MTGCLTLICLMHTLGAGTVLLSNDNTVVYQTPTTYSYCTKTSGYYICTTTKQTLFNSSSSVPFN